MLGLGQMASGETVRDSDGDYQTSRAAKGGCMNYTPEQIAAAARLVPDSVAVITEDSHWKPMVFRALGGDWQPWADTEAGRSDWAVLETAVMQWCANHDMTDDVHGLHWGVNEASISGDLKQRQRATMAAAIAIGETMGVSDDN
jgi:hypothetical protein